MNDTLTAKQAVAAISTSSLTRAQKLLAASLVTQSRSFTYTFTNGKSEELLILDVTHFLNHRVNTKLIDAIGDELAETIEPYLPDVILTAPSSGNIPAISTSLHMESMPDVIYAPKGQPITMQEVFQSKSRSYTHGKAVDLTVSKDCLLPGTKVAICDDFLDTGKTAIDLINICDQAQAIPTVFFFVIEKPYHGRELLIERGVHDEDIVSLIKIDEMAEGKIKLSGFEKWFELART